MEENLKPCPWCNGKSKIRTLNLMGNYSMAWCEECLAQGPRAQTKQGAITAWNNREREEEMEKIICTRIEELVKHPGIQAELVKKYKNGMTKKECKEWLINGAIASLFISQEERQRLGEK